MRVARQAWLVVALWVLATSPASAQSTRQRLDEISARIDQLEQVVQGQALVELAQKVEALNADVRALRGDLEVLQNENAELRKQQAAAFADFDRRIGMHAEPASASPVASAAPAAPSADQPTPAVPQPSPEAAPTPAAESIPPEQRYGRAFDSLKAGDYPAAIAGMREFIARHPDHPLADNAYYWLGQTYYLNREYAPAIEAFASVGSRSPDSAKAPDALLKRGLSELELKRTEAAKRSFNDLVTRYPASDSARLAREQLLRLR